MEISKALALVLLVTPLTFAFLLLSGYPVYLAFFAAFTVIIMTHYETSQRVSRRRELLMEEIPLFLSMLVTLCSRVSFFRKPSRHVPEPFPKTALSDTKSES
jgi:Flp pilus assembly protein TadB